MTASPALKSWQDAFDAQPRAATQRRAFAEFLAKGLPTAKVDAWKYTDLRRLALKQFAMAAGGSTSLPPTLLPFEQRIVIVDGAVVHCLGSAKESGALAAVTQVQPAMMPSINGDTAFALLNAALSTTHLAIDVAANSTLSDPIYIAHVWTGAANSVMTHPRITLTLGRNSKATIVEHYLGTNSNANFTNSVLDINVSTDAALDHIRIQDDTDNTNISQIRGIVGQGASYRNYHYIFGGGLSRSDFDVRLTGADARTELHGLVFARDTQHLDVRTCIRHEVPNTQSREDYRGIADHRGRVIFNGKVIVAKDAQHTDAAQSSRNLVLSPHAEVDTRPELEIYANDVKCAHGATVGQLDATALFYLQSRGIAHEEARALLTHAFAAELIERIPVDLVRERVLARFNERARAGAAA